MILVVATGNRGKLAEYRALLAGCGVDLRSLADVPGAPHADESGDTYVANARLKARAVAAHTGLVALADDSGLEVDALGGAPGVHSARFAADAGLSGSGGADRANIDLLLERLHGVPEQERTARFRCAIVVARPNGSELLAEGACEGVILPAPRGSAGFGYDPVFFFPPLARSFAELTPAEKDRVSHRAVAVARLRRELGDFLAGRT